jgi:hypothetical protein
VSVSSDMMAKLEMTKARLFQGDRNSAVIAVATDGDKIDEAVARANAFIAILPRGGLLPEAR